MSKKYPDEKSARRDIVEAGRRLYSRGFVCANDGNLSARISDNAVIATPSGVSKGFMTEDMLLKLDMDGNVLPSNVLPSNASAGSASAGGAMGSNKSYGNAPGQGLKPSSEIKMHLAIYRRSSDIAAVCHAHPPVSSAFAAAGVALDQAFLQETVVSLGVIPVAEYAKPGTQELANSAAQYCRDYHGVLLEHHGPVSWGDSVIGALYRMESIEYSATVAMYSKMLGFSRTMDKDRIAELVSKRPDWGITASLGEFK